MGEVRDGLPVRTVSCRHHPQARIGVLGDAGEPAHECGGKPRPRSSGCRWPRTIPSPPCVRVVVAACSLLPHHWRTRTEHLPSWQGWAHSEYARADAATWAAECWLDWDARRGFQFVVLERGRMIGAAGVGEINTVRQDGNLGYWTRTDAAGRGIATAAATAVARFAFAHAGLRRLHLWHAIGNEGSRRVAEKVGFVREGRLRAYTMLLGAPVDAVMYSVISPSEIAPEPALGE